MKPLLSKLLQMLVTLFGVTFLTFSLTYLAPGDPVSMILETAEISVSQELIEQTKKEWGLDKPFLVQYARWAGGVMKGDLGMSYSAKKPVADKLMEGFEGTVLLATVTLIFAISLSLPLGILSAVYSNKLPDNIVRLFSFVGVSMPNFWIGLMLLYVFGLKLGLFPIATATVSLHGVILPAVTLAIYMSSKLVRQIRTVIMDELHKDYVMGARARGISEMNIMLKHILPNSLLPIITILGMTVGWLLGGVAVIEMVFSWPGMGNMAVRAISFRDYPLIEGFVLWEAVIYMIVNFLVDLSYAYLDPKLKKGGA